MCMGRVASLQPPLSTSDLLEPVTAISDPVAWNDMLNMVRLWVHGRRDLPSDFCDHVCIESIIRQPVTLLSLELERVRRTLKGVDVPFEGVSLDGRRWPTQDVFKLLPVPPPSFPQDRVSDEQAVAGQEEVRACEGCSGAGKTPCVQCEGSGKVVCEQCGGDGQIKCGSCGGTGALVQGGESLTSCQACAGKGTVPCRACKRKGQIQCAVCDGDGDVTCDMCRGHGKLKRGWVLNTETWTESRARLRCLEQWAGKIEQVMTEADIIIERQWLAHDDLRPPGDLARAVPPTLFAAANELCQAAVQDQGVLDPATEKIYGLRLRFRGTYVLRVTYQYQGLPGTIVLGGTKNKVLLSEAPRTRVTFLQRLLNWLDRLLSVFGLGEPAMFSREYTQGARTGTVHISDPRCLVPVLQDCGASISVTPEGYKVTVSASTNGGGELTVVFDVRVLVNQSQERILSTVCRLGPAHRDRFPQALALNHRLGVGHIAVVTDPQTKDEYFAVVDRRPYESLHESQYTCILIDLSHEILRLQNERLLC